MALELTSNEVISSILFPVDSPIIATNSFPGYKIPPPPENPFKQAFGFIPSAGSSLMEIVQDSEGRPVKFKYISGDQALLNKNILQLIQATFLPDFIALF